MIKLKKLTSCALMVAAVSLGASVVEAAIPEPIPSSGFGSWTGGTGTSIDFGGGDTHLSVSLGSPTQVNFFAENIANTGSEFALFIDDTFTSWTSVDLNGSLGNPSGGLFEGSWTGGLDGTHLFSLVVAPDSGAGQGAMRWSFNLAAAPIPEPEIYAMMAAGLGLMGYLGRRRKGRGAAAAA